MYFGRSVEGGADGVRCGQSSMRTEAVERTQWTETRRDGTSQVKDDVTRWKSSSRDRGWNSASGDPDGTGRDGYASIASRSEVATESTGYVEGAST